MLQALFRLALIIRLSAIGLVSVSAAQALELDITTAGSAGSFVTSSLRQYAGAVSKSAQGKLSVAIKIQEQGRPPSELLDGLKRRQLAVIELPLTDLHLSDPLPGMDALPYLALNFPRAQKLWRVVRPRLAAALAKRGLRLLYAIPVSAPGLISRRPLVHAGDFRGRAILDRGGPVGRLIQISGADGLRVKADAVASAFKHQGLDFIFMSPRQAVQDQVWRYARHFMRIPAWVPKHLVVADGAYFKSLDKDLRTLLLLTGAGAERAAWAAIERRDGNDIQALRDYGMNIIKPSIALQLELQKLGRKLLFAWSEGAGDAGARLVEQYYAIR